MAVVYQSSNAYCIEPIPFAHSRLSMDAISTNKELLGFRNKLLDDPEAEVVHSAPSHVEKRIEHRQIPGIVLEAIYEARDESWHTPDSIDYASLGVIEPDGSAMRVVVSHKELLNWNAGRDPLTGMILDYFRSHFDAEQSLG